MAIGSIGSGSGSAYTIGGKPLGVQLGNKSGAELFGGGGSSAESLFAITSTATASAGVQVDANQMVLKGIQDEIDRTLGYRTDLSVTEKQKLADLQTEIGQYNETAQARSLTQAELGERGDLYIEAYAILGKDYVDVAADEFLTEKSDELSDLMARKPVGAEAKQLERLETMRDGIYSRIEDLGESGAEIYYRQIRSISARISELTAPRDITELSAEEIRQHDEIADEINDYAGQELQIKSDKRLKIARLQKTMELVQQGGVNTLI